MAYISEEFANPILDYWFGREVFTPPSDYYMGITKEIPRDNGAGFIEPEDSSYDRVKLPNNKITFSDSENKTVVIKIGAKFPRAKIDWGSILYQGIFGSKKGVDIKEPLIWSPLAEPFDILEDDGLGFEANINSISLGVCNPDLNKSIMNIPFGNKLMDFLFGKITPTSYPKYYFGVSTRPIQSTGAGYLEPTIDPNYKRIEITNDKNSFTYAVNKQLSIKKELNFAQASVSWVDPITHWFLATGETGDNIIISNTVKKPKTIKEGQVMSLSENDISIGLENC